MKKQLLLLLMIVSPLIGQEKQESKKIWSPKVSIFSTIYGISDFKGSTLPVMSVGLDWMVGKKVYSYGKMQFNYRIGNYLSSPEKFLSPMSLEIQSLGLGFYLLDTRKKIYLRAGQW